MKKAIRKAWRKLSGHGDSLTKSETAVVDQFHQLYYHTGDQGGTWKNTRWLGVPTAKCPFDMWVYQEILFELRPDVILEAGTALGGSALYLASICDILKQGKILTVDIAKRNDWPVHPRIQYLVGSSVAPEIIQEMQRQIKPTDKVLVVLDSDHHKPHVLAELRTYSKLVTVGSYMIVEDSNVNGHPVFPDHGPGPMEAMDEFQAENHDFELDKSRLKFFLTFNPRGYLKRVK